MFELPSIEADVAREATRARVACKVLRGRRRGESGWLVVQMAYGGQQDIHHYELETDARAAADRLVQADNLPSMSLRMGRATPEAGYMLLTQPKWRL